VFYQANRLSLMRIIFFNHHHIPVMELGHLLTRSRLTYPEVSSKICHDSFCQSASSVSLPWVVNYEAFCLHVVSSFSCIPVICPKLELFSTLFLVPIPCIIQYTGHFIMFCMITNIYNKKTKGHTLTLWRRKFFLNISTPCM
jgi:hypothetical protein